MSASSAGSYARQVANASTPERKLDLLARSMAELASAVGDIDERLKAVEQNVSIVVANTL